jgi:hypothetical protein
MGEFLHKYNTDNVHSRAVIVGMVNLLNSKIYFENVLSDSTIDNVYVPFFYNMGGDERFLQDYFLEWNDCIHPRHADGNYDVIPRGIVTMTNKNIDTGKLTHRFVRGTFIKEVNGELQQFNSYLNSLPISMSFSVEIEVDSNLDAFKVEQAIMETFYKVQVFSVNFRGFRIPCQAGFADSFGVEKTFEFTYQTNARTLVKFDIELETYYPVLDPTTQRSNANRINLGGNSVALQENWPETYVKPRIVMESPKPNEKYFSNGSMPITWSNTGPILRINIYCRIIGTEEWQPIILNHPNNGFYNWIVPYYNFNGDEVPFEPQRATVITSSGRSAHVRPIIDAVGGVDQIVIFDGGIAYSGVDTIDVNIFPTPPMPPDGFVSPIIQATVVSGIVIGTNIIDTGSGFIPSPITELEFKIQDANSEQIYSGFEESVNFTGDVDNSLSNPENTYITNINPTVEEISKRTNIVGLHIEGIGLQPNSQIIAVDVITNKIVINNIVTGIAIGSSYVTSPAAGKIYVQ